MKTIKYSLGLILSVLLVTSCASKWPEYKVTNEDVSWESRGKTVLMEADETPIVINMQRGVADEALSVPISFEDKNGIFTISTSKVDFAVGEYTKSINLSYDYASLTPGKEYKFSISFPESIAGDGSFSTFEGKGMMGLEYEDYLDGYYSFVYAYGPGTLSRDGAFLEELDSTPIKLQLAKGTDSYYKLIFLNNQAALEFEALCNGGSGEIDVNKYSGYNDDLTDLGGGEYALYYKNDDGTYLLNLAPVYCDLENASGYLSTPVIKPGDELWLLTWVALNNKWLNGGAAVYHVIGFK